jgi:hypothetical protein
VMTVEEVRFSVAKALFRRWPATRRANRYWTGAGRSVPPIAA